MSQSTMKVVIPMAGLGTRLRPHTWSKPKQLVTVAGKAVIDHVIDSLATLPDPNNIELVNIVGYLGDQIEDYLTEKYPHIKAHYIVQENPLGQSHAVQLARQYLNGPMLMVFADTLIKTDLSSLDSETAQAIAWVKPVPDPRRFGVVVLDENGWASRLIEKPEQPVSDLAIVGFYYFQNSADLLSCIDEQMKRGLSLNGEYYLADAINLMIERGLKMRIQSVEVWLDAGTPDAILDTNRYLLENGLDNSSTIEVNPNVVLIPPVFIHPTAQVSQSIIGPNVSLGAGCQVAHSILQDSILEDEAIARNVILEHSLVGRRVELSRRAAVVNAGDNTVVVL